MLTVHLLSSDLLKESPLAQGPLDFSKASITIGRGSGADLILEHEALSRIHCQIDLHPDRQLTLTDLGSTNGVFVENKRIPMFRPLALKKSQSFSLAGQIQLKVEVVSAEKSPSELGQAAVAAIASEDFQRFELSGLVQVDQLLKEQHAPQAEESKSLEHLEEKKGKAETHTYSSQNEEESSQNKEDSGPHKMRMINLELEDQPNQALHLDKLSPLAQKLSSLQHSGSAKKKASSYKSEQARKAQQKTDEQDQSLSYTWIVLGMALAGAGYYYFAR